MLKDAGRKFKLNFDGEGAKNSIKKNKIQKKKKHKKFMLAFNIPSKYPKKKECILYLLKS